MRKTTMLKIFLSRTDVKITRVAEYKCILPGRYDAAVRLQAKETEDDGRVFTASKNISSDRRGGTKPDYLQSRASWNIRALEMINPRTAFRIIEDFYTRPIERELTEAFESFGCGIKNCGNIAYDTDDTAYYLCDDCPKGGSSATTVQEYFDSDTKESAKYYVELRGYKIGGPNMPEFVAVKNTSYLRTDKKQFDDDRQYKTNDKYFLFYNNEIFGGPLAKKIFKRMRQESRFRGAEKIQGVPQIYRDAFMGRANEGK